MTVFGRLAQLVERTLSMREVEGLKPLLSKCIYNFLLVWPSWLGRGAYVSEIEGSSPSMSNLRYFYFCFMFAFVVSTSNFKPNHLKDKRN